MKTRDTKKRSTLPIAPTPATGAAGSGADARDFEVALERALIPEAESAGPAVRSTRLLFDPKALAANPPGSARDAQQYPNTQYAPKTRTVAPEIAIADHYGKRRTSLEEAILEVYHADLSIKRAEDLSKKLWGKRVSLGKISELAREIDGEVATWLGQPLSRRYPYVYFDGTPLRRAGGNDGLRPSVLVAVGVNQQGLREALGVAEGSREDPAAVEAFWRELKARGLDHVQLIVGDRTPAAMQATKRVFPNAAYQACTSQFCEHALALTSGADLFRVTEVLQQIHTSPSLFAAREAAARAAGTLRKLDLDGVADYIDEAIEDTLVYYRFPVAHWPSLRSNDSLRRILREIRERARVVGAFSDHRSAIVMVSARLRQIARKTWAHRRYLKPAKDSDQPTVRVA